MTAIVKRRLAGVAFLLIPALLIALSIAIYNKAFTPVEMVTLKTGSIGHEMHQGADVKLRGVVVGQVRGISADGTGAQLKLALNPPQAKLVPADVRAQMLPTTVFGARYVALIPPAGGRGPAIKSGAVINEDRTSNAIELQEVLKNTMSLLTAVRPAELSATLTAMAQALDGRGAQLGRNLVQLDAYLAKLNPHLPELNRNIRQLVGVAGSYADAAPDLLRALNDFTVTSKTIVDQRANLLRLYETVGSGAADLTRFLRANGDNLIDLSATSRPGLELLAKYAPEFPCTFKTLAELVPLMDRALGKGTDRPGAHVKINSVQHTGRYLPGKDTPRYDAKGGPRCYPVPYDPNNAQPPAGLGVANSPGENAVVNGLAGGQADWSSVLVGPIYRGAEVVVR